MLKQLEDMSVSFGKANASGVVRIGVSRICLDLLAATSIETARTMPRVSYYVEIDRVAPLLARLESCKLDVAMVSGPVEAHKFCIHAVSWDRMLSLGRLSAIDGGAASCTAQRATQGFTDLVRAIRLVLLECGHGGPARAGC